MSSIAESSFTRKIPSQEEISRISAIIEEHKKSIESKTSQVVERYFKSCKRKIFELKEFPNFIIKMGDSISKNTDDDYTEEEASLMLNELQENMLITIQKAAASIEQLGLHRCVVPHVCLAALSNGERYWIEEKLPGITGCDDAIVASQREYVLLDTDPSLKQKWIEIFTQTAQFIIETGYYDISKNWNNIMLMEEGVGFFDFEEVVPSERYISLGLSRLLEMTPPACIDPLVDVILKNAQEKVIRWINRDLKRPIESLKQTG